MDKTKLESILRVDHAGEYGAGRIYQGQLQVLGDSDIGPLLHTMLAQEKGHLARFDQQLNKRELPPTLFQPLWHHAGYLLGVGSALLGKKAAMACTAAVEEAIDEHYRQQMGILEDALEHAEDPEAKEVYELIKDCHQDELHHLDLAIAHQAEEMPAYPVFKSIIKGFCKIAISLSEKA